MRKALLAVVVASCSSHTTQPVAPPAPAPVPNSTPTVTPVPPTAAAPPEPYTLVANADATWRPHKCRKTVWPSYDSDYDDDNTPPTPPDPAYQVSEGGGCGRTLDDKAAEIARTRPHGGVCDTRHRTALEAEILGLPARTPDPTGVKAWDRKSPLEHADLVRSTLALTPADTKVLEHTGFVVPERLQYSDYTHAYYDVHRGQLPVYITADSILHAVYASHDELIAGLEKAKLLAHLDAALGAMHCGLPLAAKQYPDDVANDLDLYLTVARSLLAGEDVPSELGKVDGMALPIVGAIKDATAGLGTVDMFGRQRSFDATQYTPRGHYTDGGDLERYFRTAMWLSRTELNLVSRDSRSSAPGYVADTRETPREAVVALALADLADRTRASAHIGALDEAWTHFAGLREDISFAELEKLRAKAGIKSLREANVAERLRTAIGDGYQRTVNVHPMPNVERLPAIATMIGPRITPDTIGLGTITAERGPALQAAEVGFMLGHDRGLAYATDPTARPRLAKARDQLIHAPLHDDLYSHWLDAIRALAHKPQGALPAFMDGAAFQDLRLDSAIAAYGQLRHNHVLIAAQVYDQGGCEIPDGYVEPAIETYKALVEYAKLGRTTFRALDPKDTTRGIAYFTRLERLMKVLVALSREELANRPLSPAAKRFLSMIVEMRVASAEGYMGTFPVATWDGWYIDLFPSMDASFKSAAFIADYATFNRDGMTGIHYIGAKGPRLGVFVVDVGGKPRMMVGPVATGFQHTGPLAKRLTDDEADTVAGTAPWAASYTVPAVPAPHLAIELERELPAVAEARGRPGRGRNRPGAFRRPREDKDKLAPNTLRLESPDDLGEVTVELLDHHFVKLASIKVKVGKGRIDTLLAPQPRPIESVRVIAGKFHTRLDLSLDGLLSARLGARPTATAE